MYDEFDSTFDILGFLGMLSVAFIALLMGTSAGHIWYKFSVYFFPEAETLMYPIGIIVTVIGFKILFKFPKIYLYSSLVWTAIVAVLPFLNFISTSGFTIETTSYSICAGILIWLIGHTVTKSGYSYLKGK